MEHKKQRCLLKLGLGSSASILELRAFLKGCLILQVSFCLSDGEFGPCLWCWNCYRLWSRPELEILV